jgi:hypothetical protein
MALELGSFKQARAGVTAAFFAMAPVVASFAGATLASLPASSAFAQSVKKAHAVVTTPRVTVPPASSSTEEPKAISMVHCRFLFELATDTLEKEGKNYLSPTTRKGFNALFAFGEDELPHCNGPAETRVIPWETGTDYGFIMTMADFGTRAYKESKIDFRADYGIKPALRPTVRGVPVGSIEGAKAPALAAK